MSAKLLILGILIIVLVFGIVIVSAEYNSIYGAKDDRVTYTDPFNKTENKNVVNNYNKAVDSNSRNLEDENYYATDSQCSKKVEVCSGLPQERKVSCYTELVQMRGCGKDYLPPQTQNICVKVRVDNCGRQEVVETSCIVVPEQVRDSGKLMVPEQVKSNACYYQVDQSIGPGNCLY